MAGGSMTPSGRRKRQSAHCATCTLWPGGRLVRNHPRPLDIEAGDEQMHRPADGSTRLKLLDRNSTNVLP
jgi:hypothetical protein